MEFVRGTHDEVRSQFLQVVGVVAHRLHGVAVQDGVVLAAKITDGL